MTAASTRQDRQQQQVIEYLAEENGVLEEQLGSHLPQVEPAFATT